MDLDGETAATDHVTVTIEAERALTLSVRGSSPGRRSIRTVFTVRAKGRATLALYNVLGQRVRTLYDDHTVPGRLHSTKVRATRLQSGTYFLHLRAAEGTETKRIMVVR